MKKLLITYSLLLNPYYYAYAQNKYLDSLKTAIKESRADTTTIVDLLYMGFYFENKNADSELSYLNQAYELAVKAKNDRYMASTLINMGNYYANNINFQKGLELSFEALKIWDKIGDTASMAYAWGHIGSIYDDLDDLDLSIYYEKKAKVIYKKYITKYGTYGVIQMNNGIGYEYTLLNMPDSALPYFQESYNLINNEHEGFDTAEYALTLWGLGKVNYQLGNLSIAMPYYKKSIENYGNRTGRGYYPGLAYSGMGELLKAMGNYDSSIIYYRKSLKIESEPKQKMIIYQSLANLYQTTDKDIAFGYLKKGFELSDSINKANNKKEVKNMTLNEQERQRAIAEKQKQEKEQRKENIQYALIALGLVISIILFLLLSRSIITNTKIIELLGVMALLIVFEFLNLFLHPILEKYTHNTPLLMLLALVCIAALLVPLHHRLEKWATSRLVEKNKQIRLAAAKKTIEKLEKQPTTD